ncbi:HEPN domain-containing protein [Cyanobium sp. WKJ7-Wakatipu]|uniref:HEPN domain-containing protein n=1 Tax=Cyanobium sp. WKJ7-Wakatipu TaxID=2823726 RepID=UPI0020CE31D5|nr:HEPN domain-containing protein [Cyanobium sp. WKJ7-Wakatipu]MCP9784589.1 HEPN domain-containing protein [Cyanobium sp. WKJ7-Wakatipu]
MPSDRQREAARMLRIAQRDLKTARSMLDTDLFDEASWGFHVQQATEKALKAWISALEQVYPRTHDLSLLDQLIFDFGGDPTRFQSLENFTPFGSVLRYDDEPDFLNLDRAFWNQLCADLLDHVGSLLP